MAKDDKGLLEDLIGESIEDTQSTVNPAAAPQGLPAEGDMIDDDEVMSELVQRKTKNSNKRLVALSVVLLLLGCLGAAVKFGLVTLPGMPKRPKPGEITRLPLPLKPNVPVVKVPAAKPQENATVPASTEQKAAEAPATTSAPTTTTAAIAPAAPAAASAPSTPTQPAKPLSPSPAPVANKNFALEKPMEKPAEKVAVKSAPKPVSKPVVDEEIPQALPATSVGGGQYTIQVGAYLYKSSLKEPLEKIKQAGLKPIIGSSPHAVTMHRVLVGKFKSKQVAQAALKDLAEEGIKAQIVQNKAGFFSAETGTFLFQKDAEKNRKHLEEFGYDVYIERSKTKKPMQELRVGTYASKEAAQNDLERLRSKGLAPVVLAVQ